jgi:hypothetical protein
MAICHIVSQVTTSPNRLLSALIDNAIRALESRIPTSQDHIVVISIKLLATGEVLVASINLSTCPLDIGHVGG